MYVWVCRVLPFIAADAVFQAAYAGLEVNETISKVGLRKDDFDGFGAGGVVFQEALEGGNLALIQGSQVGMEPHRFVQKAGKLFRDLALARLECF